MGCALAVHAQGLLSTLLSHALCVVPRNEKHTPQHKHRAHGDDSPRKGRFVKVVTPRKVLEVEEGAAAQGDGADEKGGRLELVEHINSVRLEVRVHGQEHQGDQADREDLNGNIVLQQRDSGSYDCLPEHAEALVPEDAGAVVVAQEEVADPHPPLEQLVPVGPHLQEGLERETERVEPHEHEAEHDSPLVLLRAAHDGHLVGQDPEVVVELATFENVQHHRVDHCVGEKPKHLAGHYEDVPQCSLESHHLFCLYSHTYPA